MARPITSIPKPRPQDEASRLVDFVTGRSRQHPADPAMAENVYAPDVVSSTRAFSISGNNGGGAGKYVDF